MGSNRRRILPGQFSDLLSSLKIRIKNKNRLWDAYQQYKDGEIVEWTGDEKAEKPHSLTTIAKGTSLTGEHGEVSNVERMKVLVICS